MHAMTTWRLNTVKIEKNTDQGKTFRVSEIMLRKIKTTLRGFIFKLICLTQDLNC